jgi:ribosomal protein RSM22 (predicted rRNA methylase)
LVGSLPGSGCRFGIGETCRHQQQAQQWDILRSTHSFQQICKKSDVRVEELAVRFHKFQLFLNDIVERPSASHRRRILSPPYKRKSREIVLNF